jgi:hypothetical protein
MSQMQEPTFRVRVDPTNPGQFFACCGLLELADRFWGGAEGWFEDARFCVGPLDAGTSRDSTLCGLLSAIAGASLRQVDADDDYSSPIEIPSPFDLRLDWWGDDRGGGRRLKVWAGKMGSVRIARAMQQVLQRPDIQNDALLDYGAVVYDPLVPDNKVEPFYFDARRGASAHPIDVGFSLDSLGMTTVAYPAVEFLCLVGLQRFRPLPAEIARVFDYATWELPLSVHVAPMAVLGLLPNVGGRRFRFENAFRTDQKKHKSFTPATRVEGRTENERSIDEPQEVTT